MIRKQIAIDEELAEGLRTLAARTGKSEAAHIRAALRSYLDANLPPLRNPLVQLIGLVDLAQGPRDVAAEHDHYLYGAPKRRPR